MEIFQNTEIILHTADIVRNRNGFEQLTNSSIRSRFYKHLNTLMSELDYSVIACAIQKIEFVEHQDNHILEIDPYLLCLRNLIE